ncbi:MAG: tetratricopeptide repeat protein [Lautropia sp.]|nr:tetratricopeptide repeat protein [Lautropia sp.]
MSSSRPPHSCHPSHLAARSLITLGLLALAGCASLGGSSSASDAQTRADQPHPSAQTAPMQGNPDGTSPEAQTEETASRAPYRPENLPLIALTPPLVYEILAAEVALQRQQPQLAYSTYHTLAMQTHDARLARRATEIALHANALNEALPTARLWHKLDPKLPEAQQTLDTLLVATGHLEEAEPALAKRLAAARENRTLPLTYQQLQRQLLSAPKPEQGWRVIQRLSEPDLQITEARLTRAQLAAAAGHRQTALDEAEAARALSPDDQDVVLTTAQLLQTMPDGPKRAIELLQQHLKRHPAHTPVRIALGRLLIANEQRDEAIQTLEQLPPAEQNSPLALYTLAQLHYQKQALDQASHYLERYVKLPDSIPRDNGPAYLFLAEIAEQRPDMPAAIEWLAQIQSDQSPLYLEAISRRAILTARQNKVEAGLALLGTVHTKNAKEAQMLLATRAQILREAHQYQEAFKLLDRAVKGPEDATDLLYDHALAAEKIKRLDILEKSLRTLIKRRPDNAHAYNALGYTLADHDIRLPEALKLIQKANELMPNNAHVLDSLGWVYFRMGKQAEALSTLKKAHDLQPDVEIAVHYGEVLWSDGQKDTARDIWRAARKRSPDNELLQQTLKRLKVSL